MKNATPRTRSLPWTDLCGARALLCCLALGLSPAPGRAQGLADLRQVLIHDSQVTGLQLPEGPASRAWSGLSPDVVAAHATPAFMPWPRWESEKWDDASPWSFWSTALREPERPRTTEERLTLTLCALGQDRFDDAWTHFAGIEDEATQRRLIEQFVPGYWGNIPHTPPLLQPALPAPFDDPRSPRAREMISAPFFFSGAVLQLRVLFEPGQGVQVDIEHLEGSAVELQVRIPLPHDATCKAVYIDWAEQEEPLRTVHVKVSPEETKVSLWAALIPNEPYFPHTLPDRLPEGILRGGIDLREADGRTVHFVRKLQGRLSFPINHTGTNGPGPLRIRTAEGGDDLRTMVSMAERFLLASAEKHSQTTDTR